MSDAKYTISDYKSDLKPIWCPGCGDYAVLNALHKAFVQLQIPPKDIAIISGIGCSSRLPGYCKTYGFNSIHGRAIPIASGVKLANPELTVLAVGGDGDGFAIGGGHLPHAARRNSNMTYIVMDNNIYGLTKGQLSPTSRLRQKTKTSVHGSIDRPINPCTLCLAYGVSFIGRTSSLHIEHMTEMFVEAIRHEGFSFVQVLSPCVTYMGKEQYDLLRENTEMVARQHDVGSRGQALAIIESTSPIYLGTLYHIHHPTYEALLDQYRREHPKNEAPLLDAFAVPMFKDE